MYRKQDMERELPSYKKGGQVIFKHPYGYLSRCVQRDGNQHLCHSLGEIMAVNRRSGRIKVRLLNSCDPRGIV